ncbi:S41 family peptidase, partial [Lachnotalea glycerini]
NSPGLEAGILPGDILYKVDGTEVTGMEISNVVAMIKGEEGTTVNLTLVREGVSENIELTVERKQIEIPTISYEVLDNNIGYIYISEFDTITESQFTSALDDLNKQGIDGLVVDLRDNPGGNLDVVNSILDQILPEGMIVYTEDKYGEREEYKSDEENQFNKPLAVLINGNSASASEIFAGAIKDYGIGTLVGTKTFGKGIVQRLIELGDGTAMKLTISKYYTPKGYNIHKIGIEPDVEIELDESLKTQAVITHDEDNQLQKALEIIREKLQQ